MNLTLAGLQFSNCLVYIDDIIIRGRDFEDYLENLQSVLECLRDASLHIKPSKCVLFQKQVLYLGHVVSQEGVATDPGKTNKVASGQHQLLYWRSSISLV